MKLDLKEIQKHQTNLNSQELGNDKDRIKKGWRKPNPVFDEAEVKNMTDVGVRDLAKMQLSDGGWGWFSGYDEHSYPHTTATVVHGLQIARKNGVKLPPGMLERGIDWLKNYQVAAARYAQERSEQDQAVEGTCRQPRRPGLHGPGRRRLAQCRHARLPLPRPHRAGCLRQGDVRPGPAQGRADGPARHDPQEHRAIRRAGQGEPDRLPALPDDNAGGTGTAAKSRPTPTISSCWPAPVRRTKSRAGW